MTHQRSTQPKVLIQYRRPLLILAGVAAVMTVVLVILIIALIRHPALAQPLIERTLSAHIGLTVRFEHLELGATPLRLKASGVSISPGPSATGFQFDARALDVHAALSGPLGRRTLTIEMLRLKRFNLSLSGRFKPFHSPGGGAPTIVGRWLGWLVRFAAFRDVVLRRVEVLRGALIFQTTDQTAHISVARMRSEQNGDVTIDGGVRFENVAGIRVIELPDIQANIPLGGFAPQGRRTGSLAIKNGWIDAETMAATDVNVLSRIAFRPSLEALFLEDFRLDGRFEPASAAFDSAVDSLAVRVSANGVFRTSSRQLTISEWSLISGERLDLHGSARMELASPFPFQLRLNNGRIDLNGLLQRQAVSRRDGQPFLTTTGNADLEGELKGRLAEPLQNWRLSLNARLDQIPAGGRRTDYRLDGTVSGRLQLSGSLFRPSLKADVRIAEATLTGSPVDLAPFEARIDLDGRYPDYRAAWQMRIPRIEMQTPERRYRMEHVVVSTQKGTFNPLSGKFAFPSVTVSSGLLGKLQATIDGSKQRLRIRVTGSDVDWPAVAGQWGLIPPGWRISGGNRISATWIVDGVHGCAIDARVILDGLAAASPDERYLIDGLQTLVDLELNYSRDTRRLTGVAGLSLDRGEALLGRFYHSFQTNPLTLEGRGEFQKPNRQVIVDDLHLDLKNLLALQANGRLSPGSEDQWFSGTVRLPETDLAPLFGYFLASPYKFENLSLEKVSVAGRIGGRFRIDGLRRGWTVRGRLVWNDGRISVRDNPFAANGIELDLPVWHQSHTNRSPAAPMPGSLKMADLRLPHLPSRPFGLTFSVSPDSLTTTAPLSINVADGHLQLDTVYVESIYSSRLLAASRLIVRDAALKALLGDALKVCREGKLDGTLERIRWSDNNLAGHGTLTAEVCGGKIDMINPGIRNVFSSSPVIVLDSRIRGVDLKQLTEGTAFGRIQGRLNGWIRNLEVVNGQPQGFDLLLETERTDGVPQKINFRAVQNIARLGGGDNPFTGLAGTLLDAFEDFSYSKIGIRAGLKNDTFRVNGTVKEDGKEYLVKKGGLFGVDVVNLNPDNRISFKDMLERIQRIEQSKGGPIIK